ncbi:MAG: HYC_CC_PP family protein [Mangrovibacterium sp.]
MKPIFKISLSLIVVLSTLLSTTGVVFYYHYCKGSEQKYVSMYVDNTQELCHEQKHDAAHDCCQTEKETNDCCEDHNVDTISYKLTDFFLASEKHTIPVFSFTGLVLLTWHATDLLSLQLSEQPNSTPLLTTLIGSKENYGRILSIRQHKLKLYC